MEKKLSRLKCDIGIHILGHLDIRDTPKKGILWNQGMQDMQVFLNESGWQKIDAGTRGCKIVYYVEYIRAEFKAIRSTAEAEEAKTLQKAKKALHA